MSNRQYEKVTEVESLRIVLKSYYFQEGSRVNQRVVGHINRLINEAPHRAKKKEKKNGINI